MLSNLTCSWSLVEACRHCVYSVAPTRPNNRQHWEDCIIATHFFINSVEKTCQLNICSFFAWFLPVQRERERERGGGGSVYFNTRLEMGALQPLSPNPTLACENNSWLITSPAPALSPRSQGYAMHVHSALLVRQSSGDWMPHVRYYSLQSLVRCPRH